MRLDSGNGNGPRVALITCARVPALDDDTRKVVEPLAALGITAVPMVWDDAHADWTRINLAVVRSCWDYVARRSAFLKWSVGMRRLANPADVLAWNTDKRYLLDLEAAGVPIVPTTWIEPDQLWSQPSAGEWVVKPAVSIASLDTGRYRLDDEGELTLARSHVARLHAHCRTAMIQPYVRGVDEEGETSLVYLGGTFSHAVRKAAVLSGPDEGIDRRFIPQGGLSLRPHSPSADELRIAERTLAAVPGGPERLLYARVDLVPGDDWEPVLLELELTEPMLYLGQAPDAAVRFAKAISGAIGVEAA